MRHQLRIRAPGAAPRMVVAVLAMTAAVSVPYASAADAVSDSASASVSALAPVPTSRPGTRTYSFHALLDGKPIGDHRFTVSTEGGNHTLASEADFSVRFLGFQAYHYHHRADEQWTGDCLAALTAATDDDGKPTRVRLERDGDTNRISTATGRTTEPGCLMSYAYWNPALRTRTRLLNPQTGKVDAVRIERAGSGTLAVHGQDVAATRWRIVSADATVDVWYSAQGEWIGLDSLVGGKHQLSYRLP